MESGSIFAKKKLIAVCSNIHDQNRVICRKMSSYLRMLKPITNYDTPPRDIRKKLKIGINNAIKDLKYVPS